MADRGPRIVFPRSPAEGQIHKEKDRLASEVAATETGASLKVSASENEGQLWIPLRNG